MYFGIKSLVVCIKLCKTEDIVRERAVRISAVFARTFCSLVRILLPYIEDNDSSFHVFSDSDVRQVWRRIPSLRNHGCRK